MNTLVIFDTQFGNTETLARAVGKRLESHGPVRVLSVAEAAGVDLSGVDLLLIGGPTQGHRARQLLRDWVDQLSSEDLQGLKVAAFDTRLSWPMFFSGSAAKSVANILRKHNTSTVLPPESFIVDQSEGPLVSGEIERAEAWADVVAANVELGLKAEVHS